MIISLPLKFGIGFFAGLCAMIFPRLIPELATASDSEVVELFSRNYVVLSLVFALLIGGVITIFEYEVSCSPKDIFMSALAIPGVLSGSLNTTESVIAFEKVAIASIQMENILEQNFPIPNLPPAKLTPLTKATTSGSETHQLSLFFLNDARADNGTLNQVADYGIGIKRSRPSYFIVLDEAGSKNEAERKAAALRDSIPVQIFRDNNGMFFITTTGGPQNKSNALIEAIRLKNDKGLNPSLMEMK